MGYKAPQTADNYLLSIESAKYKLQKFKCRKT